MDYSKNLNDSHYRLKRLGFSPMGTSEKTVQSPSDSEPIHTTRTEGLLTPEQVHDILHYQPYSPKASPIVRTEFAWIRCTLVFAVIVVLSAFLYQSIELQFQRSHRAAEGLVQAQSNHSNNLQHYENLKNLSAGAAFEGNALEGNALEALKVFRQNTSGDLLKSSRIPASIQKLLDGFNR